jgi:hypothetical protein
VFGSRRAEVRPRGGFLRTERGGEEQTSQARERAERRMRAHAGIVAAPRPDGERGTAGRRAYRP